MGTPDFAVPSLDALVGAGHEVACVYTQPPRPAGRGRRVQRSAVHEAALAHKLAVCTPATLKDAATQAEFAALRADACVVVAYGLILPKPILEAPRLGCVNVHASLLPRWRGAAPIQRALLAGDRETGVTIMRMDQGLDTGPILAQEPIPIPPTATASGMHDLLAWAGARLLVPTLEAFAAGKIVPRPQPAVGATYAKKLTREDGALDWREPAEALARRVRALEPWPGAWFEAKGERVKVLAAGYALDRPKAGPGTVLDGGPERVLAVACGQGALRITHVQRPGRAAMEASEFLRGFALPPGTVLPPNATPAERP
jgi:methionyl-tRNA formyltransferase